MGCWAHMERPADRTGKPDDFLILPKVLHCASFQHTRLHSPNHVSPEPGRFKGQLTKPASKKTASGQGDTATTHHADLGTVSQATGVKPAGSPSPLPAPGPPIPSPHTPPGSGRAVGFVGVLECQASLPQAAPSVAGRGKRPKDWVSHLPRKPGPQSHRLSSLPAPG